MGNFRNSARRTRSRLDVSFRGAYLRAEEAADRALVRFEAVLKAFNAAAPGPDRVRLRRAKDKAWLAYRRLFRIETRALRRCPPLFS
ncbi:hypothetical protein F53441_6850 [Fusarium austroafricanum]|uniref:Uncharacterized protein n=1 Tax=Fusarium austroafricanum TaxID=2364996 RepID=A0A8H4KGX0_9HYPO|nr:hypothetical protein F53441_6850 [Fusarium austroafricanum]